MDRVRRAAIDGALRRGAVALALVAALAPTAAHAQAPRLHDNGKIAFVAFRDGDPEVYKMNSNGSQTVRLTRNFGPAPGLPLLDFWPSWSSDGAQIVFTSFRPAPGPAGINPDVYTMDASGRILRRITTHPAGDLDPMFSPDSRRIVFVRELPSPNPDDPRQDIYIVNADGSGETNLTRSAESETEPAFSPDGRRIVFEREVGPAAGHAIGNHEIFTMSVDGSDVRRLTSTPEAEQHPSFSPDGSRIVFDTNFHAPPFVRGAIFSMRADGSDRRTLTPGRTDRHGLASFSPDGTKIVFTASEDIWVMDSDGSGQRRLTGHPSPDIQPSWQPLGLFAGCSPRADNQIDGTAAGERISGTPEPDRIFAGGGNDRVGGRARGDCIDLGSGSDRGAGGAGKDRINGGRGNDRINGGARNDRLLGDSGRDRISGGSGRDRISGGSGRDRIRSRDGRGDRVDCGSGRDTVTADRVDRLRRCESVSATEAERGGPEWALSFESESSGRTSSRLAATCSPTWGARSRTKCSRHGFEVCVRHVGAAASGTRCTVHARLVEVVEGRKLRFEVEVREGDRSVGVGTHERRIVDAAGFDGTGSVPRFGLGSL